MEESTSAELDFEVNVGHPSLLDVDCLSAALLVAVALDVHDAVEVPVPQVDVDKDTVSETVHLKINHG